MLTSNILSATKDYLETSGLLRYNPRDPWSIQLTPDERPFPSSDNSVITLYSIRSTRSPGQQVQFTSEIELCLTRRVKSSPYDRQYITIYTELLNSLVNFTEILGIALDSNNSLLNTIRTNIISNRNSIVTAIDELTTTSSEGLSDSIANHIYTAEVMGPIVVPEFIIRPIPRYDDFFTAYNTSKNVVPPNGELRLQPSGYSTKVRMTGLSITLPNFC